MLLWCQKRAFSFRSGALPKPDARWRRSAVFLFDYSEFEFRNGHRKLTPTLRPDLW